VLPFTPFHLGPGLAFGLALRRRLHAPTFIIANLIVDVEPFIILLLKLRLPLHWVLHSLLGALSLGILLAFTMYSLRKYFTDFFRVLRLEYSDLSLKNYVLAGTTGTLFHVILDYPLYSDIKPFYPLTYNPLYNPNLTIQIYMFCSIMFILGLIEYMILLLKR